VSASEMIWAAREVEEKERARAMVPRMPHLHIDYELQDNGNTSLICVKGKGFGAVCWADGALLDDMDRLTNPI